MCPNYSFDLSWKKQVLIFQLFAVLAANRKRFKTGLKSVFAAQTIVSALDDSVERNQDYLIAINTLTGYFLLQIDKPKEALEFIEIGESIAFRLIER